MRDPLVDRCGVCDAAPGELCPTAIGLHWVRARAAGMTPDEMLAWRPAEGRPVRAHPTGTEVAAGALADLEIALAALDAACDLAEQRGAAPAEVARLRDVGRSIARTDARRAS